MDNERIIPESIGIIMDGNRRWAKAKGLPSKMGHHAGAEAVRNICKAATELGIKYITLYAFSTENWKREPDEIKEIMNLIRQFLKECESKLIGEDNRICFIGDKSRLDEDIREKMLELETSTKERTGTCITVAVNYGGRDDIIRAAMKMIKANDNKELLLSDITEEEFSKYLDTGIHGIKDPELIIRTSGEQRTSNFLTYQSAYSEYYFTDLNWPDFNKEELLKAIDSYNERNRRLGV